MDCQTRLHSMELNFGMGHADRRYARPCPEPQPDLFCSCSTAVSRSRWASPTASCGTELQKPGRTGSCRAGDCSMNVQPLPHLSPDRSRCSADPPSGLGRQLLQQRCRHEQAAENGALRLPRHASCLRTLRGRSPRRRRTTWRLTFTRRRARNSTQRTKVIDGALRWKQDRTVFWSRSWFYTRGGEAICSVFP